MGKGKGWAAERARDWEFWLQQQIKWREPQRHSTKNRNKTRLSALYLFNIVPEVLARAIRQLKEIKEIQIGNKEVKHCYLQMIVFISDSKNSTRELLQLVNTFSKVDKCKIN